MAEDSEKTNPVDKLTPQQIEDMLGLHNIVELGKGNYRKAIKDPTDQDRESVRSTNVHREFDSKSIGERISQLRSKSQDQIVNSRRKHTTDSMLSEMITEKPSGEAELIAYIRPGRNLGGAIMYFETLLSPDPKIDRINIASYLIDDRFFMDKITKYKDGKEKKEELATINSNNLKRRTIQDYNEFERIKFKLEGYLAKR